MAMILGCIGDDFTGSSDLGLMLARGGMRTTQYVGVPDTAADPDVEAGIVALKSRSIAVGDAVAQSLEAYAWLRAQGCETFYFKYCSTFDSTPQGNIGPVIDALIDAIGTDAPVLVCPAFPATGRSVYQGHLFVGDRLLSESGMERHPLTPMTDPDIRRWLAHQTGRGVGHLPHGRLREARAVLADNVAAGRQLVVADAIDDNDLVVLCEAARGFPLLTGGSGLALGLPATLGARGGAMHWVGETGPALLLSGSCSQATRAQIEDFLALGGRGRKIDVDAVLGGGETADDLIDWALSDDAPALIYSSAAPGEVAATQSRHGSEKVAGALDALFAQLARLAAERGVRRIVSAGGESSGAVVQGLGIRSLEIGPAIDPGVPALRATERPLVLALKSGNFGSVDFFGKAARMLEAE